MQDHVFWKFLGWAAGLIITMGAVYAMYAKSLSNKKSVKELSRELDDIKREFAVMKDQLNRIEKHTDKQDAAIEKIADRVYDQK